MVFKCDIHYCNILSVTVVQYNNFKDSAVTSCSVNLCSRGISRGQTCHTCGHNQGTIIYDLVSKLGHPISTNQAVMYKVTIMHDQEKASNLQPIKIDEPGACLKEPFVKILLYTLLSKVIDD